MVRAKVDNTIDDLIGYSYPSSDDIINNASKHTNQIDINESIIATKQENKQGTEEAEEKSEEETMAIHPSFIEIANFL